MIQVILHMRWKKDLKSGVQLWHTIHGNRGTCGHVSWRGKTGTLVGYVDLEGCVCGETSSQLLKTLYEMCESSQGWRCTLCFQPHNTIRLLEPQCNIFFLVGNLVGWGDEIRSLEGNMWTSLPTHRQWSNKRNSAEKKQRRGSRRGKSKATWLRSAGSREKKVSTNKCPCVTHCREVRVFKKREKATEDCP